MEVKLINPEQIAVSATNTRGKINKKAADYQELLTSVKGAGVICPLQIIALNGKSKGPHLYECIAGERRLTAAKDAKLDAIPCVILPPDRAKAQLVQYVENTCREDLGLVADSRAVAALLSAHKRNTETVAGILGRSQAWVLSRARIAAHLHPGFIAIFENKDYEDDNIDFEEDDESSVRKWTAAHFAEVAKYPREMQASLLSDALSYRCPETVKEIKEYMEELQIDLSLADFDTTKDVILPMALDVEPGTYFHFGKKKNILSACTGCSQQTNNQPVLFQDDKGKVVNKCQSENCFWMKTAKTISHRIREELDSRDKDSTYLIFDFTNRRLGLCLRDFFNLKFTALYELEKCKKADDGARYLIFASGKRGYYARPESKKKPSRSSSSTDTKKKPAKEASEAEKKEHRLLQLKNKRQIWINQEVIRQLEEKKLTDLVVSKDHLVQDVLIMLANVFGTYRSGRSSVLSYFDSQGIDDQAELFGSVMRSIRECLSYNGTILGWEKEAWVTVQRIVETFGLNLDALEKTSKNEVPTPKSLK